jgi:hypothetical protein
MALNRKWHEVDLMKLYTQTSFVEWNNFLTVCVHNQDVMTLEKTYYGIQIGMDCLTKKKLSNDKMSIWYFRLAKSLENTVKTIYKQKYPSPLDDPIAAQSLMISHPLEYQKHLAKKRNRDELYEAWLRKVAF